MNGLTIPNHLSKKSHSISLNLGPGIHCLQHSPSPDPVTVHISGFKAGTHQDDHRPRGTSVSISRTRLFGTVSIVVPSQRVRQSLSGRPEIALIGS